ncbi:hypothetical protein [Blastococcus haudaquaticus]|uniref:Peptidase S9 n=1 Tax=Blastococcus haudaquaticus TaxID=1938745 RepID=A0A286GQ29_9ACTN|nr:hypothetical protein [Blastococcus haudaquaticus]SOD97647.1 hypothetical protein SAMN06272739_1569 [Blastococcus haudaquaticus]
MNVPPKPSRTVAALVAGTATTAYYATPDLVTSRRARGWVKAGLVAISSAAAVPEVRAAWAGSREQQDPDGVTLGSLPLRSKVVVFGVVGAALACAVSGARIAERWAFRHGEARAAAGKRLPHTGPALVYGAVATGLALLPAPSPTPGAAPE